ncbi:hypothetical protein [Embleya sp. NBC_00896]|nr:hypothetical protein OG928_29620 [Embleya sp. NBC_00896]
MWWDALGNYVTSLGYGTSDRPSTSGGHTAANGFT